MNLSEPSDEKPTPVQEELEAYCRFLDQVCGLAPATLISRRRIVGEFLSSRFGDGQIDTSSFESHDLMQYVALRVRGYKPGTASVIATAIRSYLKFLQFRGGVDPALVRIIPSPPQWRLQDFPNILSDIQVTALMNSFDLSHPAGLRDSAMTLCMLHMGLRAGEVANLSLDDLNWRRSILYIRRDKSRTCRALPLLIGCGNALANYLKQGRPPCTSRKVFVRHTVPIGSDMTAENVRGAIRRAYERAGFPRQWTGTHILRHTAATHMLNKGATLKDVADVLGHKSIDTTVIYTKVNLKGLQAVSQPWPGALS
jgi:site-specific recombinase XerD